MNEFVVISSQNLMEAQEMNNQSFSSFDTLSTSLQEHFHLTTTTGTATAITTTAFPVKTTTPGEIATSFNSTKQNINLKYYLLDAQVGTSM